MGRFMEVILWVILLVRAAIAVLLATMGITTLLATGFHVVFQPPSADFTGTGLWMVKPLAIGIILLVVAYLVSRTFTKFQKFIVVTIVFVLSAMSLYSLVSGMNWTASLQAQEPGIFDPPLTALKQINDMIRDLAGL
jgi:MFS superfamily sulfate permease-like transporter